MKKSKLSVGLVTSFIGALALTACNETTQAVTPKDDSIIELIGYNGENDKIEIKTDLYNELKETKDGVQLYYNAILEALIRYEYPKLSQQPNSTLKSITLLENEAGEKVDAAKETAAETARQNHTDPNEEWDKVLESHDCKTDEDLKKFYLYDLEKKEITKWHYDENMEELKNEYIGVSKTWQPVAPAIENVDPVYPYHVLHILVTLGADKADYTRGTISESEAAKLWQVVRQLIDGQYSFQEIAMNKTDDTGSKDQYGDVEIMSTKTSFYNEFKLGVYAYDAILSGLNTEGTGEDANPAYKALGLDASKTVVTETTSTQIKEEKVVDMLKQEMISRVNLPVSSTTIPAIPYEVFKRIGEVAKEDKIGTFAPEAGDVALPRNVLYNQFLNFHSPFVITDEDIVPGSSFDDDTVATVSHNFANPTGDNTLKLASTNFKQVALPTTGGSTVNKNVVADKSGNVIIGVRSEAGIHFMVMRKSIFENTNASVGKQSTSLQDYYTTYIPGEEGYPESGETFVNMKTTSDESYYTNRANTIKNEIQSTSTFDAAYDYRLYEALMDNELVKGKIHFADEKEGSSAIEKAIEDYISLLRETKHNGDVDSINKAWQSYLLMLRGQNDVRNYKGSLMPTTCAFSFNSANKAEFEEGGRCYVQK